MGEHEKAVAERRRESDAAAREEERAQKAANERERMAQKRATLWERRNQRKVDEFEEQRRAAMGSMEAAMEGLLENHLEKSQRQQAKSTQAPRQVKSAQQAPSAQQASRAKPDGLRRQHGGGESKQGGLERSDSAETPVTATPIPSPADATSDGHDLVSKAGMQRGAADAVGQKGRASVATLRGVGPKRAKVLTEAGLGEVGAVAALPEERWKQLAEATALSPKTLAAIVAAAREALAL